MANIIKIKRKPRNNGAGVPQNLQAGELAYSEADSKLYIGRTNPDNSTVDPTEIGGSGYVLEAIRNNIDESTIVRTSGNQTISGTKTFTSIPIFSGSYNNGELFIGSSNTGLVKSTLTEGDGVDIANGAGSITISLDNTVVRTTGTQTIDGLKTFNKSATFSSGLSVSTDATFNNNVNITGTLTTLGSIVSSGVDLTDIINKLIPPAPPTISSRSLSMAASVGAVANRKLCSFGAGTVSLNGNTVGNGNINNTAGHTITNVIFSSGSNGAYSTSSITGIGPGTNGTVSVVKNTSAVGQITMTTGINNGSNSDLIIENDRDYSVIAGPTVASGFWQSFDTRATGLSASGWNSVFIRHSGSSFNNSSLSLDWYYDPTSTLPSVANVAVATGAGSTSFSSSIPHWSGQFIISFTVGNLSSDTYTDSFINAIPSGNALQQILATTRQTVGLSGTPPRNYLVGSSQNISITGTTLATAFRSIVAANFMPSNSLVVNNSRGSTAVSVTPSGPVLIKTFTGPNASFLQEDNIPATNFAGSSSYGIRISGYGTTTDTPSAGSLTNWVSSTSLADGDATVVGGVLSHDRTNYSTYIPPGPNLSLRSSSTPQYFTFKFVRNPLSQFAIRITAPNGIAGLWVRLPGLTDNLLDSSKNGWTDASKVYNDNLKFSTSTDGSARDGVLTLNSALNNLLHVITFGTLSAANSTNNEIHVRIKLANNQTVTALSLEAAT